MYKIYVRQHLPWHRRNSPSSEFSILNRPQVAYLGLSSPKLAFFEPLIDILEPPKYIFLMSKVIQIHLGHRPENGKFPSLIRPQFFFAFLTSNRVSRVQKHKFLLCRMLQICLWWHLPRRSPWKSQKAVSPISPYILGSYQNRGSKTAGGHNLHTLLSKSFHFLAI